MGRRGAIGDAEDDAMEPYALEGLEEVRELVPDSTTRSDANADRLSGLVGKAL